MDFLLTVLMGVYGKKVNVPVIWAKGTPFDTMVCTQMLGIVVYSKEIIPKA